VRTTFSPTASVATTSCGWDYDNRLTSVTLPGSLTHNYVYDYRTRRIVLSEPGTAPLAMTYSGGLSVAEYEVIDPLLGTLGALPTVEYQRGPDMGGGVGGLLYSLRSGTAKYNLSNGRGDVVAQSDASGALTWTASYEAYGKRPVETGSNVDRQRGNTKEEDPTGLLNEGFRYRDLETGTWLSRDPAGFVDGPNLYAYVRQNPWTFWDPLGLEFYGYEPAILTDKEREVISGENKKQAVVGAVAVVAVGAAVVAPEVYAYVLLNPGTVYLVTEAGTTVVEIGTGYDGPPIVPGPGDVLRAEVIAARRATEAGEELVKDAGEQSMKHLREQADKLAKQLEDRKQAALNQTAETITKNAEQGAQAEGLVGEQLLQEGKTILGKRVTVDTSEGRRVLDYFTNEGKLKNVEVKSGGARRSPSQIAKDNVMATEGGTPLGKNAPQALRGKKVQIETEVRQVDYEEIKAYLKDTPPNGN
jgi:RHS repeat-associated protein